MRATGDAVRLRPSTARRVSDPLVRRHGAPFLPPKAGPRPACPSSAAVAPLPSAHAALFLTRTLGGAPRSSGVIVTVPSVAKAKSRARLAAQLADVLSAGRDRQGHCRRAGRATAGGRVPALLGRRVAPCLVGQRRRRRRRVHRGPDVRQSTAQAGGSLLSSWRPESQLWRLHGTPPEPVRYTLASSTDLWITGVSNAVPRGPSSHACASGSPPAVEFCTSRGSRQAAPLTGLAELRLLSSVEPFLALAEQEAVRLPSGAIEPLPVLEVSPSGFSFSFPPRRVELIDVER